MTDVQKPEAARPRVLVVDDEPLIGRAITRLLRDSFAVTCVTSGPDALAALTEPEAFDAVLCDLSMPGMSGMELYEQVGPWAKGRFVFLTGGAMNEQARAFLSSVTGPRLTKPFDGMELRRVVAEIAGVAARR